jgi:hypothetical protein
VREVDPAFRVTPEGVASADHPTIS